MSNSQSGDEPAPFSSRNTDLADMAAIQEFIDEGVVASVLNVIKSGKEATVYRCRAGRGVGPRFVAAKVYHAAGFRNFGNAAVYSEGREILNGQVRRAVAKRTEFGREAAAAIWVNREFDTLSALFEAGADVAEPYFATERAILMEYFGDEESAAEQLQHAELEAEEARQLWERILWNIELWMHHNYVHADLSAYNLLYWNGKVTAIDFPQAIDPRFNRAARDLLGRDVRNVAAYFRKYGSEAEADRIADDLWRRWEMGRV
jgi:RIO kinase 1